jgi:hypothetical protein
MEAIAPYWKAVCAFLAPAMTIVIASVLEGSDGGTRVTGSEWLTAAATAVLTAGTVYTVRNKPVRRASAKKRAPVVDDDPPEHRAGGPVI